MKPGKQQSVLDTIGLPALPESWCWVSTNDLFSFITSGSRGWAQHYANDGAIFLRVGNLDHASISIDLTGIQRVRVPAGPEALRTRVQPGDLLISVTADVGMVGVVPASVEEAYVNQHVAITRPIDGVCRPYLAWYLASQHGGQRQFRSLQRGATKAGLGLDDLQAVRVPFAPLKEQGCIVAKIEELFSDLDAGVAALERVKAKLKRYRAAVLKAAVEGKLTEKWRRKNHPKETGRQLLDRILQERRRKWEEGQLAAYGKAGKKPPAGWKDKYTEPAGPEESSLPDLPDGWCWATIHQLAEVILGKMLDKQKHQTGRLLPYLRNINVRWGSVDTDDMLEMYFEDGELDRFGLKKGDVLVCEGGEPGRAAVWDGRLSGMKFQKALHRVRCHDDLQPAYVVCLLENYAKSGHLEQFFTGSTIKHFTRESFVATPIPLPPIAEQEQFVAEVETRLSISQAADSQVNANLKRSARLRQSILKRAFEGKLVPQDPNDVPASVLLERLKATKENGNPKTSTKPARKTK